MCCIGREASEGPPPRRSGSDAPPMGVLFRVFSVSGGVRRRRGGGRGLRRRGAGVPRERGDGGGDGNGPEGKAEIAVGRLEVRRAGGGGGGSEAAIVIVVLSVGEIMSQPGASEEISLPTDDTLVGQSVVRVFLGDKESWQQVLCDPHDRFPISGSENFSFGLK